MTSVIRIYLLYLKAVVIAAGPGAQYRMQVRNMFTVNFKYIITIDKHMANYRAVKLYEATSR